jgi:hypothetical protein
MNVTSDDLVDTKLKTIIDEINEIVSKWKYTSADLFLKHAADGTLRDAEPDAISLTNLLDKRKELHHLIWTWSKSK